MKQSLRKLLLSVPGFQAGCRLLTRHHVRSLMYHRFAPDDLSLPGRINQKTLREHMAIIKGSYTVATPDAHLESLDGHRSGPCPVVVTIDDGYLDCFENALPIFKENRIPAMLFTTTGFVAGTNWFWWDKLSWLMGQAQDKVWEVEILGTLQSLDLSDDARRHAAWNTLADRCRFLKERETHAILDGLAATFGCPLPASAPAPYAPCNWDQIREMVAGGMLIGAHTVTHPILTRVPAEEARIEIRDSQAHLQQELGFPVPWFCYPQGGPADFDPTVKKMVAEYYQGSYLAYQETQTPIDRYLMPRYHAPADMTQLQWLLCGAEYLVLKLRAKLGLHVGPGESYWSGSEPTEDSP